MVREPVVAGMFYEKDSKKLLNQIENCFTHPLGPGKLIDKKRKGSLFAVISPHAGYDYSGPAAAFGFNEISKSKFADVYLIIGVNHQGSGSSISIDDWNTPFGIIKTDKEFARELSMNINVQINEDYHRYEHSIEVLLPFLWYVSQDNISKLRVLCMTVSYEAEIDKIAEKLKRFLKSQNIKITLIISSDFTHYGSSYGYVPFSRNIENRLSQLDKKAIELILLKDSKYFLSYVKNTGITICGAIPIYLLLLILDNQKGELLNYYTSAKITNDMTNSVSYASIMFK